MYVCMHMYINCNLTWLSYFYVLLVDDPDINASKGQGTDIRQSSSEEFIVKGIGLFLGL